MDTEDELAPDPLLAVFVRDQDSIGKERATTALQRWRALQACVELWRGEDIHMIERVDHKPSQRHGWAMWRRS